MQEPSEIAAECGLAQPLSEAAVRHYEQHQGQLQARIEQLQPALEQFKQQRKQTPARSRFKTCRSQTVSRNCDGAKVLPDTIKMIAYRAETSMASTLREKLKRSTMRELYCDRSMTPRPI